MRARHAAFLLLFALVATLACGPREPRTDTNGSPAERNEGTLGDAATPESALVDATAPPLPVDAAAITGIVTAVGPGRTIRIEVEPQAASGSAKAQVSVPEAARIQDRSGRLRRFDEIARGARVSAWFDGPVAESYPVQARARVLVIEPVP